MFGNAKSRQSKLRFVRDHCVSFLWQAYMATILRCQMLERMTSPQLERRGSHTKGLQFAHLDAEVRKQTGYNFAHGQG